MIPPFDRSTGNLPAGVYEATWGELVTHYGYTPHRLALLAGLKAAVDALRAAGCRRVYIDGSFITTKDVPGDFDACWEVDGVELAHLDPVLLTFANRREAQKRKYGGELFPADWAADAMGTNFLHFLSKSAEHVAWTIATCEERGIATIEATPEAEEEWLQLLLGVAMGIAGYSTSCTPGYYNAEQGRDTKAARNLVYTGSLLEYAGYLQRWREEGDLSGARVVTVDEHA